MAIIVFLGCLMQMWVIKELSASLRMKVSHWTRARS